MVSYVALEVARIKNISYEEVVDITTKNAIIAYNMENIWDLE